MPCRSIATRIVQLEDDARDIDRITLAVASALEYLGSSLGQYRLESQTLTTIYRQAGPQVVVCCVGVSLGGGPGDGGAPPGPAPEGPPGQKLRLPGLEPSRN